MIIAQSNSDGLGFGIMDLLMPGAGAMKESMEAKKVAEEEKRKAAAEERKAAAIFCAPPMVPNPAYVSIPVDQRAQAAAAGIQACIKAGAAAGKAACFFTVMGRKFRCSQMGFDDALAYARQSAAGGRAVLLLRVLGRSISLTACVMPSGAVVPGAAAAAAGVIPATPGPGGTFSCPSGMEIARDAQNRVVCAPPGGPAAAAADRGRGRRGRKERGTKGRRGGRGMSGGLGDYLAMIQNFDRYARATRNEQGGPALPPMGIHPGYGPRVPDWMQRQLPPEGSLAGYSFNVG